MQEKIVDIIVFILRKMKKEIHLKDIDMKILAKKGYTPNEISTALSWLEENISRKSKSTIEKSKNKTNAFRILHNIERGVINSEAFGYLIELKELGIINDVETENIIDRLMASELLVVSIEEMKAIVSSFILEGKISGRNFTISPSHNFDTIH
ncbi:MAG: DUF494 family protein [Bacteroidota bacterium]